MQKQITYNKESERNNLVFIKKSVFVLSYKVIHNFVSIFQFF